MKFLINKAVYEEMIDPAVGIAAELRAMIFSAVKTLAPDTKLRDIRVEHPAQEAFGDYSTNIAMKIGPKLKKNPRDLALLIKDLLEKDKKFKERFEKSGVAGGAFINISVKSPMLGNLLGKVLTLKDNYGGGDLWKNKKILLEHTSPNPQSTIMLGHLRNNFLGMAVSRILEFEGATVKKDCIVNDRGIHICRSMFGYLVFASRKWGLPLAKLKSFREVTDEEVANLIRGKNWQEMITYWKDHRSDWFVPADLEIKPDHANLIWYVLGSRAYKLSEEVQKQVGDMLVVWETRDKATWDLWKMILDWSAEGYAQTYQRIGSTHDWVWHESDHFEKGKSVVKDGLAKGVFKESEGAVVTDLEKYGLPNTVVQKTDGTALYHTQDLALTRLKQERFPSDLYIWDIGEEQSLYFKQLFAMCEQLGLGRREDYYHLNYSLVNIKGGKKMATRTGDVVMADEILDLMSQRAAEIIRSSKERLDLSESEVSKIAESVGVAALKYSLLKYSRGTTMQFDIDESFALEGNSGPYLQYTYARTQSVLRKSHKSLDYRLQTTDYRLNVEELSLLRWLYRFPEVVAGAAVQFAPNLICNFLFELAQRFNLFYQKHRILESDGGRQAVDGGPQSTDYRPQTNFRLVLTAAVGQVLKNGLNLLGIATLERM
jgi:arginyl-tRNA synthetase